jgi:hypothetical protein
VTAYETAERTVAQSPQANLKSPTRIHRAGLLLRLLEAVRWQFWFLSSSERDKKQFPIASAPKLATFQWTKTVSASPPVRTPDCYDSAAVLVARAARPEEVVTATFADLVVERDRLLIGAMVTSAERVLHDGTTAAVPVERGALRVVANELHLKF